MCIVVTGAAGFIGAALSARLLERGERVVGIDNFDPYYDPALKTARAARLETSSGFRLRRGDIVDPAVVAALVGEARPRAIVHLAGQAGVRHAMRDPFAYERVNLGGHLSVLEAARAGGVGHLVYASSSSVYGERDLDGPFRENDPVDAPASLYAATKRGAELMSLAYTRLHGLPQTGLRFFTAYGPWGRPDMAYFDFTRAILAGEPIEVFGEGRMARDFTYVDDIVDGVLGVLDHPAEMGEHRLFNVGGDQPEGLLKMIATLEQALGREAVKRWLPMQPGDVSATWADVSKLRALCGYAPKTDLETGIAQFVEWYRSYFMF